MNDNSKGYNVDTDILKEPTSEFMTKLDLLKKLYELQSCGVTLSQNYSMDSALEELQFEYSIQHDQHRLKMIEQTQKAMTALFISAGKCAVTYVRSQSISTLSSYKALFIEILCCVVERFTSAIASAIATVIAEAQYPAKCASTATVSTTVSTTCSSEESIRAKQNTVKLMGNAMIGIIKGTEMLNSYYSMLDIQLSGLSDKITSDMNNYNAVLGDIYEKYSQLGTCRQSLDNQLDPVVKLCFMITSACLSVQITNGLGFLGPVSGNELSGDEINTQDDVNTMQKLRLSAIHHRSESKDFDTIQKLRLSAMNHRYESTDSDSTDSESTDLDSTNLETKDSELTDLDPTDHHYRFYDLPQVTS